MNSEAHEQAKQANNIVFVAKQSTSWIDYRSTALTLQKHYK